MAQYLSQVIKEKEGSLQERNVEIQRLGQREKDLKMMVEKMDIINK